MKGPPVNPKLMKLVVKGLLSISIATAIGYTIKMEKKAEERIDDYYDANDTQDN